MPDGAKAARALADVPLGASFLVGGESGVGKSRLLEEVRIHALLNGALPLRGQCQAEGGQPFHLWRDVVRRLILEQELTDLEAGILRELVPDITEMLGREIPPVPPIEFKSAQVRLIDSILRLFQNLISPTLLILDDLQWAGESLLPLTQLLSICDRLPLLIVGSYRTEEAPTLPGKIPAMRHLVLHRFSPVATAELTVAIMGRVQNQDRLVEYLYRQSEGNALFLVEVMRTLAEEAGSLGRVGLHPLPRQVFSGGITQIVARRLERLPAEALPALELAAVGGQNVDEALMRLLIGEEVDRWLQAGLNAGILEVEDARWRFAHDRLRSAVLNLVPISDLPELHHRVAEGMERLYPGDETFAAALLEHWRLAGDFEQEAAYAAIVIEQRMGLGSLNDANQMLERALQLKPQDSQVLLKLHLLGGTIAYDLGKPAVSAEFYADGLKLARRLGAAGAVGRALEGLGNAAYAASDFEEAQRWYEQSLEHRRVINDLRGVASSLHFLSILHRFRGDYSASRQALEESIALRRLTHDVHGLGDSIYQMNIHARLRGDYDAAVALLEEGSALRRSIADGRGLGDDLNNLGIAYTLKGEYAKGQAALLESMRMRQVRENLRGVASCRNALGELYMVQGDTSRAIRFFGTALGIWFGAHDRWNIANAQANLGYAQAIVLELNSAKHHLYEGLSLARRIPAMFVVLKALIGWAQIMMAEGQSFQAAMLLGMIDHHAAMTAQLRQIYFQPVQSRLDMTVYAEDYESGKSLGVEGMVNMILVAFRDETL
ncbi:MAG: tetratricopeptide repeat protein [Chloroflexi bacterium]|nr:tetratricopeptide repeat protein [Chloroflexota bacterium]